MRLAVTIWVAKPGIVRVRGYDKHVANTVYFDREAGSGERPVSGRFTLYFNFPFPFGRLGITVKDASSRTFGTYVKGGNVVKIESIKRQPLLTHKLDVQGPTREFIGFAKWFAYVCGNLPADTYTDKGKQFTIRYLEQIRDYDTGELIPTPARVNHVTGIIEVCRKDFVPMTVVNRLYILMHEWTHFANKTTDEVECDLHAAQTVLDLGYDRMETLNSVAKLFMYNTDLPVSQRTEQERRVGMVKDFAQRYLKTDY